VHTLLIALAITAAVYVIAVAALFLAGRRTAAREIALLLPNLLVLFKGLTGDPRVPRRAKALLIVGAVWFASPIDLIPEFIPVLGPLDDAVVAALILRHILHKAGPDVVAQHWHGDPATLDRLLRLTTRRTHPGTREATSPNPGQGHLREPAAPRRFRPEEHL
jgi:uncharacterized membrane protein YkvA (DUF1232 family)